MGRCEAFATSLASMFGIDTYYEYKCEQALVLEHPVHPTTIKTKAHSISTNRFFSKIPAAPVTFYASNGESLIPEPQFKRALLQKGVIEGPTSASDRVFEEPISIYNLSFARDKNKDSYAIFDKWAGANGDNIDATAISTARTRTTYHVVNVESLVPRLVGAITVMAVVMALLPRSHINCNCQLRLG